MVRAKFYVLSKTQYANQYTNQFNVRVELQPVYGDSDENKTFFDATPSGKIDMSMKPEAAEHFDLGKQYYVDFTPVE